MGADRAYFVRLDASNATSAAAGARAGLGGDRARPRRRRRHVHIHISVGAVLVLLVGAWLVWAQVQAGGARTQIQHAIDDARGAVRKATTDPGLKQAATYFNRQYARDGRYSQLSEAEQRDDASADFGVGVTVEYCDPNAVVLHSLTGAGTLSRLLLHGTDAGDVLGEHHCPADLSDPLPWKPPKSV